MRLLARLTRFLRRLTGRRPSRPTPPRADPFIPDEFSDDFDGEYD